MPFSIRNDVQPAFNTTSTFSLRSAVGIAPAAGDSQSLLEAVLPSVAARNWLTFVTDVLAESATDPFHLQRNLARRQSVLFNFATVPENSESFQVLWRFIRAARAIKGRNKDEIEADIETAYQMIAQLAAGEPATTFRGIPTFDRVVERNDARFVVFSDHHFTNFTNMPNYFLDHNLPLYLEVLDHYGETDYCLVENGDLEDCLIFQPDADHSRERWRSAAWETEITGGYFTAPIDPGANRWQDFLAKRYEKREAILEDIISAFGPYYDKIVDTFVADGRYVRLSGNHDTYTDNDLESRLLERVTEMIGAPVHDVLRVHAGPVNQSDNVTHVMMHGHQIDSVCLQHGETPWAMSLGEVFSECLSWAFQGPDRFWGAFDANKWHVKEQPEPFGNRVAWADAKGLLSFGDDVDSDMAEESERRDLMDVLNRPFVDAQASGRQFFESALGHEIAWEYFELDDPFAAFALEVLTGEDQWKFRHMNETTFCDRYVDHFRQIRLDQGVDAGALVDFPKVVLGHTHEVRHLPTAPDGSAFPNGEVYLNSGSAGRFEGLIWCIEIDEGVNRVVSWSHTEDGGLRRIIWASDGAGQLVAESSTYH